MKVAATTKKPRHPAGGRALDLRRPAPVASEQSLSSGPLPNLRWPAKAHPARFSLQVAASLALAVGLAVAAALGFSLDSDTGLYVVTAGFVVVVVGAMLAQSALLYGISRFDDGRATPRKYWWVAARDGFMDTVNVDIMALIVVGWVVLVGVGLWRFTMHWALLDGLERGGLLLVVNLALGWVLIGAYTARRIALAAVVIGGVTGSEATRLGWRLYWRAGGHLTLTAAKALLGRLIVLAVVGGGAYELARWLANLSLSSQAEIVTATAVLVTVAVFLLLVVLLEWETRLWLRRYRQLAGTLTTAERVHLLTGRSPAKS